MIPKHVLIVGVGGLGCPASLGLARAGVTRLTLMDPDVVELTNLHRQPWHHAADVGQPKVRSAATKLQRAFTGLKIATRQERIDQQNAETLFTSHDLVIDATDGVETKFLLSDTSVRTGIPLIYGGVLRFEGLAMRIEPGGPCLRCLFETPPDDAPTCAQAGVLGSMAGLIGGLQASLALRVVGPHPDPFTEEEGMALLQVIDGRSLTFRSVRVRRRADCSACGPGNR